jgi:hypothetical protein
MHDRSFSRSSLRWAGALALAFGFVTLAPGAGAQELPPPDVKTKPKPRPKPPEEKEKKGEGQTGGSGGGGGGQQQAPPVLLLSNDLACTVSVDGERVATLRAKELRKVNVSAGQHLLAAVSDDGKLRWQKVVDAKAGQQVVEINLASAGAIYSTEDFDRQMARIWMGVSDLKVAGEYAASILDRAWGFHNQNLATALHTAHEYLKQQIEDLKKIVPNDPARKRMSEDVLKIAAAADKYIDLMTKAITEAQKANSWMGSPNDMYSQAKALVPGIVFPSDALETLKASKAFQEGIPLDRRPELGMAGDPRDFHLGAGYYQSTPNMLAVVAKNSLADDMGFKAGDRLISVNGQNVGSLWDLKLAMRSNAGKKIRVLFDREGKREDREMKVPSALP